MPPIMTSTQCDRSAGNASSEKQQCWKTLWRRVLHLQKRAHTVQFQHVQPKVPLGLHLLQVKLFTNSTSKERAVHIATKFPTENPTQSSATKRTPSNTLTNTNKGNHESSDVSGSSGLSILSESTESSQSSSQSSTNPDKPLPPYQTDWEFIAVAHIPNSPTPVFRNGLKSRPQQKRDRCNLSPLQRCQKYSPTSGSIGQYQLCLRIQTPLQVDDGHRAQVFSVLLCGLFDPNGDYNPEWLSETHFVAKVYDPLYIDDNEGYFDPFLCVEQYYTHEVGFYQRYQCLQGQSPGIPRYFGSYSITLQHTDEFNSLRVVRMILMEHIEGNTMSNLDCTLLSQNCRKYILHSIVELDSFIYEKDTELEDLAPRNILVELSDPDHPEIKFIDFADTLFERYREDSYIELSERFLGQYISPLLRWWSPDYEFSDWIDWDWESWLEKAFGDTATTITPEMWAVWNPE